MNIWAFLLSAYALAVFSCLGFVGIILWQQRGLRRALALLQEEEVDAH